MHAGHFLSLHGRIIYANKLRVCDLCHMFGLKECDEHYVTITAL